MRTFQTSTEIMAPAEHVWQIQTDVARWPEWTASVSSVEALTPLPLAVGSSVRLSQPGFPAAVWTVTALEPGVHFVWESHSPGMKAVAQHMLTPTAAGCVVDLSVVYEGLLGGVIGFLMRHVTQRFLEMEARGLKWQAESLPEEALVFNAS